VGIFSGVYGAKQYIEKLHAEFSLYIRIFNVPLPSNKVFKSLRKLFFS